MHKITISMCGREINARCAHCILQVKYVPFCLLLHQSVECGKLLSYERYFLHHTANSFLRNIISTKKVIFGVAK